MRPVAATEVTVIVVVKKDGVVAAGGHSLDRLPNDLMRLRKKIIAVFDKGQCGGKLGEIVSFKDVKVAAFGVDLEKIDARRASGTQETIQSNAPHREVDARGSEW